MVFRRSVTGSPGLRGDPRPGSCPARATARTLPKGCDTRPRTAHAGTRPSRGPSVGRNGLSHGVDKVNGTSQPGRLPSPRVLLHRTKDPPVPTAIPTLTELATIAHTNRCSVVATHRRHVLLDDTASPLPFLGMRFGPAVEAVAAPIGPHDHRTIVVPSTVPARRSPSTRPPVESKAISNASLRSIPHAAPSGLPLGRADARCGRSPTSSGSIAFSPPRSTRRSAIHLTGSNLAACTPWPKRGRRRARKCSLITHGTSRRHGRHFVLVRSRARPRGHRSVRPWPRGSMRDPSLVTALLRYPISTSSRPICTNCSDHRDGGECSPDSHGRDQPCAPRDALRPDAFANACEDGILKAPKRALPRGRNFCELQAW